jgi:hypothetical protein
MKQFLREKPEIAAFVVTLVALLAVLVVVVVAGNDTQRICVEWKP